MNQLTGLIPGYDEDQWGPWKSHSLLLKSTMGQLGPSLASLTEIFHSHATAGYMTAPQFLALFPEDSVSLYHPMFVLFDRNQDGLLNETDFLAGILATSPSTPHDYEAPSGELRLQFLFLFYDADRDAFLNATELQRLVDHLKQLGNEMPVETDVLIARFHNRFGYGAFYHCCKNGLLPGTHLLLRFKDDLCRPALIAARVSENFVRNSVAPTEQKILMTPPSANRRMAEAHSRLRLSSLPNLRLSALDRHSEARSSSTSTDFRPSFASAGSPRVAMHTRASVMDHQSGFNFQGFRESLDDRPHFARILHELPVQPNTTDEAHLHLPLRVIRQLIDASQKLSGRKWFDLDLVNAEEMEELTDRVNAILAQEDSLVHVPVPCRVYGDIHGNLPDLVQFFNSFSWPDRRRGDILSMNYVFLGDFVDRGAFSVEVCALLFSLKILYPKKVFLVRGNHEDRAMNGLFGFRQACQMAFGDEPGVRLWDQINCAFDNLPLAAVVDKKVLCIHGGLGQSVHRLSDLENIEKPIIIPSEVEDLESLERVDRVILDALWSDPTDNDRILGVHHSPRGQGAVKFGPDRVEEFCKINKIQLIIRAHECVQAGYEYFAAGKLLTVFSATSYCNQYTNDAAMIVLTTNERGVIEEQPQVIKAGHPDTRIGWSEGQYRSPSPIRGTRTK